MSRSWALKAKLKTQSVAFKVVKDTPSGERRLYPVFQLLGVTTCKGLPVPGYESSSMLITKPQRLHFRHLLKQESNLVRICIRVLDHQNQRVTMPLFHKIKTARKLGEGGLQVGYAGGGEGLQFYVTERDVRAAWSELDRIFFRLVMNVAL